MGVGLYAMWRERKYGWLATALVITAAIYWVSICLEGTIDQFLSGFWYSDWRRTAALQAMIAVPVAALGIAHLYGLIARHAKLNSFFEHRSGPSSDRVLVHAEFLASWHYAGADTVRVFR